MEVKEATKIIEETDKSKENSSKIFRACKVLYNEYGSYKDAAKQISKSEEWLRPREHISNLPQYIQELVVQDKISLAGADRLRKIQDYDLQRTLAWTIVDENLSNKAIKGIVEKINDGKELKKELEKYGIEREPTIIGITLSSDDFDRLRIRTLMEEEESEAEELGQKLIRKALYHYEDVNSNEVERVLSAIEIVSPSIKVSKNE